MNMNSELAQRVPSHMHDGIKRYVEDRIPPGGFLYAVLTNNLRDAFGRADSENREHIFDIVNFLYNEAPAECWGSPERVKAWLEPGNPEGSRTP